MGRLRAMLRLVGLALLLVVALLASAALHLNTHAARRAVRDLLPFLVSDALVGELVVERIDYLSLTGIAARGVTLRDRDGHDVIRARGLFLALAPYDLSERLVFFPHARVIGGHISMRDDVDGLPTLLSALTPRTDGDTEPSAFSRFIDRLSVTPHGAHIADIELHNVTVDGSLLGLSGIVGEARSGTLDIAVADEIDVSLTGIHGTLSEPFGFSADIGRIDGVLSSRAERNVELHVAASRDDESARAEVRFGSQNADRPEEGRLHVTIDAQRVSIDTLTRLGYTFLSPLVGTVQGVVELDGPPQELQLTADLQSAGGSAHVTGSLGEPVQVTVRTDGLSLANTIEGGPDMTVAGSITFVRGESDEGVAVSAELQPTRFSGLLIPSLDMSGVLLEDAFVLERLSTKARGSRIRGEGTIPFSGTTNLELTAHYDDVGRDENLRKLVPNLAGEIDANLQLRIPAAKPLQIDLRGDIAARNVRYGELHAATVKARGRVVGAVSRPRVTADVSGTAFLLSEYPLGDGSLHIDGGPRDYSIAGEFSRGGTRNFAVGGSLKVLPREVLLTANSLEVGAGESTFRGSLTGLHLMNDQSIRVDQLLLVNRSQRLEANGAVTREGSDTFTAQLQDFDLSALSALVGPRFPIREGRADATLQVTGDVTNPHFLLQGALREGHALSLSHIQAVYLVTYGDGKVELDGEVDLGELGLIRVGGTGLVAQRFRDIETALKEASYDLEISAEGLDLGRLPQLEGKLSSGHLNGGVTLKGSAAAPQVNGTLELREVCLGDDSLMSFRTEFAYGADQLTLQLVGSNQGGPLGTATVSANIPADEIADRAQTGRYWPERFEVVGNLAERNSESWPQLLATQLPVPVRAGGTFVFSRSGGPLRAQVHLEAVPLGGEFVSCQDTGHTQLVFDASATDGAAHFDTRLLMGEDVVAEGSGTAQLDLDRLLADQAPTLSHVSLEGNANVADIGTIPGLCGLGSGRLAGNITVRNALSPYPTVRGELESSFSPAGIQVSDRHQIEIRSCDSEPARLKLTFNAHAEEGFVSGTLGGCGGQNARISGHFPLRWEEAMAVPQWRDDEPLTVSVMFKQTQLRALLDRIPGVQTGEALADGVLRISGRPDDLEYWGEVELSQGRLRIIATGQTVEDVRAKIVFRERQAQIEHFEARADEGLMEMKGGFTFKGFLPEHAQIALNLTEFPLRREGIKLAWFTGSAALESDISPERSRTAIVIHRLDVRLPDRTPGSLQALDSHPDVTVVSDLTPPPEDVPYVLEFQLRSEEPFTVTRDDFQASVASELAVTYADPEVRVAGYLEFRRGNFEVFGKNFDLVQGGLRFDGGTKLDPDVNLVANHTVPNTQEQVTVTVRGHLSTPDIRFSSDACEGQAGALSMLVAGRCSEDPDNPAQAQNTESAFATGLLSGVLTLGARRELGGLIPNIAVESGRRGYATRVRAGVESESVIPAFMRPYIQKVYLQGAVSTARTETDAEYANQDASLDFLLQLYFPHNIVGSGHFAVNSWGLDLTWEP